MLATLAGCAACRRSSSSSPSRSWPPAAARTPRPPTTTSTRSTRPRASSRTKFDQLSGQITVDEHGRAGPPDARRLQQAIDKVVADFRAVKAPGQGQGAARQAHRRDLRLRQGDRQGQGGVRGRRPAGDRQGAGRSRQRRDARCRRRSTRRSLTSTRSCASNYAGPMLEGLMQNDFQLTVGAMRRRLRSCYPHQEVVTLEGDGPVRASYARGRRARRPPRARARAPRGASPATASRRSPGTPSATSSSTWRCPPTARCCTRSTSACSPSSSSTSSTTPRTASSSSTTRWSSRWPSSRRSCRACASTSSWATATSTRCPGAVSYEELLDEAGAGEFAWPELDERAAAALCYTSGTTGNPKGVLYSHRSVSLHSTTVLHGRRRRALVARPRAGDRADVPRQRVGPALRRGADRRRAAPARPASCRASRWRASCEAERATLLAGVPTVLAALLRHVDEHGGDLSSLRGGICGGSAVPRKLMEDFRAPRRAHPAGVGDDRDEPDRHRGPAAGRASTRARSTGPTARRQGRMVPWTRDPR